MSLFWYIVYRGLLYISIHEFLRISGKKTEMTRKSEILSFKSGDQGLISIL